MTDTTEEVWKVDGQSLTNWAFNISTLGGRLGVPPLEGSDEKVAYRRGQVWREKIFGPRTLSLAMWVRGATEAGTIPVGDPSQRAQFNENWSLLRRLFAVEHRQLSLEKTWRMDSGLVTATGLGQLASLIEPTMFNRVNADFVADLLMADPLFYGAQQVINLVPGGSVVHTMPGDARTHKGVIRLTNPISNPRITNTTLGIWVQLTLGDSLGGWWDIDVENFTCVRNDGLVGTPAIEHEGSVRWMEMGPGANNLSLSSDLGGSPAASATFTYSPPYF